MQEERMEDGELAVHRDEEPHKEFWVERHWSWLVIAFGVAFVVWIDRWAPTW